MKCDECIIKNCDARDLLKRHNKLKLILIVEKYCDEFKHRKDKENNS